MNKKDALALIEPLMKDDQVTGILIDNHRRVYVEKSGELLDMPSPFQNEAQVYALIAALSVPLGVIVDGAHPFAELRLPDSSRVNVVIPPIALTGPSISIRKAPQRHLSLEDLLEFHSLSEDMADFLRICVEGHVNILVSGGASSGKTQLLRILAEMIPWKERIVILQEHDPIFLNRPHLVTLETRPANMEGKGGINLRDLVGNALRMRPDRIVASGVSGDEADDLTAAMASGYDGTLLSLHANNPRDAVERLENMVSMGKPSVSLPIVRKQVASAVDLIVHLERVKDGTRKILFVTEITGMEGGMIKLFDIFQFRATGSEDGKIKGVFSATGIVPSFLGRLQEAGIKGFHADMFIPVINASSQQKKWTGADTSELDRQLADMLWVIVTAMRAGYSLRQVFEQLAVMAPEPCAGICRGLVADFKSGFSLSECFDNLKLAVPSTYLAEIATAIQQQQQIGDNLPARLEPIRASIFDQVGSDLAFSRMARDFAGVVGASLPAHLAEVQT